MSNHTPESVAIIAADTLRLLKQYENPPTLEQMRVALEAEKQDGCDHITIAHMEAVIALFEQEQNELAG